MNLLYFEFKYASLYSVDTSDEVSRYVLEKMKLI